MQKCPKCSKNGVSKWGKLFSSEKNPTNCNICDAKVFPEAISYYLLGTIFGIVLLITSINFIIYKDILSAVYIAATIFGYYLAVILFVPLRAVKENKDG